MMFLGVTVGIIYAVIRLNPPVLHSATPRQIGIMATSFGDALSCFMFSIRCKVMVTV